jgi:hypothetical protein
MSNIELVQEVPKLQTFSFWKFVYNLINGGYILKPSQNSLFNL